MAFPATGSLDYWIGGQPLVGLAKTTGDFDYWLGGRPLRTGTSAAAGGDQSVSATAVAMALTVPDASITAGGVTVQATALAAALTIPDVQITAEGAVQATAVAFPLTLPAPTLARTHVTRIELRENTTVRATWYVTPPTGSFSTSRLAISEAELNSISDWTALRLYVWATGDTEQTRVTYAGVELPGFDQTVSATAVAFPLTVMDVSPETTRTLYPDGDVTTTGWTPTPGSPSTCYDKLDEEVTDDSDYVTSPAAPADSQPLVLTFPTPFPPADTTGGAQLTIRLVKV